MKNLLNTIKDGQKIFYNKFGHYATHLRIGRGFVDDITQWETENAHEFSKYLKYSTGIVIEFDFSERNLFELSHRMATAPKLTKKDTSFIIVDELKKVEMDY